MDVYPHMMHNNLDIGNDALLPTLWPVDDSPIVCARPRDAATPSVAHDYKRVLAGMLPKQHLSILPGTADSYIEPLHFGIEPCIALAPCCPSRTDQCWSVTEVVGRSSSPEGCGSKLTSLFRA